MNKNNISQKRCDVKTQELRGKLLYHANIPLLGIEIYGFTDKTDLTDWVIIDYIRRWQFSKNSKPTPIDGKTYYWINYHHMMASLPIIKIKTKYNMGKRIRKLKKLGLVDILRAMDNTLYMRLTDLALAVYEVKLDESDNTQGDTRGDSYEIRRAKAWKNYPPANNDPTWRLFNEAFWQHYPRTHGKKKDAWVEWYILNPDDKLAEIITQSIHAHLATKEWQEGFIQHPNKFLSGRYWEAELENEPDDIQLNAHSEQRGEIVH